jgi:hypothetical protein
MAREQRHGKNHEVLNLANAHQGLMASTSAISHHETPGEAVLLATPAGFQMSLFWVQRAAFGGIIAGWKGARARRHNNHEFTA